MEKSQSKKIINYIMPIYFGSKGQYGKYASISFYLIGFYERRKQVFLKQKCNGRLCYYICLSIFFVLMYYKVVIRSAFELKTTLFNNVLKNRLFLLFLTIVIFIARRLL